MICQWMEEFSLCVFVCFFFLAFGFFSLCYLYKGCKWQLRNAGKLFIFLSFYFFKRGFGQKQCYLHIVGSWHPLLCLSGLHCKMCLRTIGLKTNHQLLSSALKMYSFQTELSLLVTFSILDLQKLKKKNGNTNHMVASSHHHSWQNKCCLATSQSAGPVVIRAALPCT